jgi:hypothetical protein
VVSFVEIFLRPQTVFTRVGQQQIWLLPFLTAVILLTAPIVLVLTSGGGIEILTLQRYENSPKLATAVGGESGIERAVNSSNDRWTKLLIVSRVAGTAGLELVALSLAFVLATMVFVSRPKFPVMLGTLSYAVIPFAFVGVFLTAIILLSTVDYSSIDLENMPALNLARLLDRTDVNPAIFAMASAMDLLTAGEILLMSFGLTRVTQLTYIQALTVCGGIWALVVLWKTALLTYF